MAFQSIVLTDEEHRLWSTATPQAEDLWRTIRLMAADQMVTFRVSFVMVMDPAGHILRTVKLEDVVDPVRHVAQILERLP